MNVMEKIKRENIREDLPEFRIGDTLSVHVRIIEDERERVQVFTGTLIARKGTGNTETITLRRVSYGLGVEKVFMVHSPRIDKIEVKRKGSARRAKLYYLREKKGRKARVKERK